MWRLNYALRELSPTRIRKHVATLENPSRFYLGLLLKLLPTKAKPVRLRLKQGGEFDINHFMSLYAYEEIFVDRCYDTQLGTDRPYIIDVGANMGLFALRMKQLYPNARIACYEPNPDNFRLLSSVIRENGLSNVAAFPKGVAGTPRDGRLYLHPGNYGGHSILPELASDRFTTIKLTDLEGVLSESGFERCDLLKLDCEGAEKEIIESIGPRTCDLFPYIVFEATPRAYDIAAVKAHLERLGYEVRFKHGLHYAALPRLLTHAAHQEIKNQIYRPT